MKKSGLADSPFFRPSTPSTPIPAESGPVTATEPIPVYTGAQSHERTDAHLHDSAFTQPHNYTDTHLRTNTDTHLNSGTDARVPNRASTQSHERTPAQPDERPRTRETYDIYEDQAQTVEELRLQWSKSRKKHITKGQVMRELLDEILPKHQ